MRRIKRAIGVLAILLIVEIVNTSVSMLDASRALNHSPLARAQPLPIWQQANNDGFGSQSADEVCALGTFQGYLYAGTSNATEGARILRSRDGLTWAPVTQAGFGIAHDIAPPAILDLTVLSGRLYASTGRGDGPAQIWRTLDGVTWAPMVITGFGDPDTVDITALTEYNGLLYAAATNLVSGTQIWRSYTGDSNTWTQQTVPAVSGTETVRITGFAVAEFDGALYAVVASSAPAQIWRSYGADWTAVVSDGFGENPATSTGGMAWFSGHLYVGVGHAAGGAQLWRTADGELWEPAIQPGFGDAQNQQVETIFVYQNRLYVSVRNVQTGMALWRSADGTHWQQVAQSGFGDRDNVGTNGSHATAEFLGALYVGTSNTVDGGELWQMQQPSPAYLPLILH